MTERVHQGSFATLLRNARESVRLSQSKLAEKAGFDHSYISRLESDTRMPTKEAVVRIAEALTADKQRVTVNRYEGVIDLPVLLDYLLASAGFLPVTPILNSPRLAALDALLPELDDEQRANVETAIGIVYQAVASYVALGVRKVLTR